MVHIQLAIEINAPVEHVWQNISDIKTHVNWMMDASEINITSDHVKGLGVTFDCETHVGPLRTTDRMEITEWIPNQIMAISHNGLVEGKGKFRLEEIPDSKTLFKWDENLSFPIFLGGEITGYFAKPVLKRIWRKNLRKLKNLLENS